MSIMTFVAGQLRRPSGLFGRFVVTKALNRSNRPLNLLTLEALDLEPGDDVLEIGFGGGDLIRGISGIPGVRSIAGADFSRDMVDVCSRRFAALIRSGKLELRCADAERLPYDPGRFSKACAVNTIYFWPDPVLPLKEIHRVLRGGGRAVITFSTRETMQKLKFTRHGYQLCEAEEVRLFLEHAGFHKVTLMPGATRVDNFFSAVGFKAAP